MTHPLYRPRRLRESPLIRRMVRETRLGVDSLILPLFAVHGRGVRDAVSSMPGVSRLSLDELLKEAKDAASMTIPSSAYASDPRGSEAYAEDGIVMLAASLASFRSSSRERRDTPGMELTASRTPRPCTAKSGRMRLSTPSRVSRTILRMSGDSR